ncbi:MAG: sodium:solute symporter, partial [Clostridia bacterium]|nr:sodium:solute symporter [Clostridia bacterium]
GRAHSTVTLIYQASASTLTLDFVNELKKKKTEEKKTLLWIRVLIVFFIVISSVIAIVQAKSSVTFIAQLMGVSWGALAGAFLAPFLYGLYLKRTSKPAVWFSFITSTVLMLANMFFRSSFPAILQSPINCGVVAMLIGLISVPVISLLTKFKNRDAVDEMFSCYEQTITVHVKNSLDDK